MSDTSIISTRSSSRDDEQRSSSSSSGYGFVIVSVLLLLIIFVSAGSSVYLLQEQAKREKERQRAKDAFKRKHKVTNKILDFIMKDGVIIKWIKVLNGPIFKEFKQLFTEIAESIFGEGGTNSSS